MYETPIHKTHQNRLEGSTSFINNKAYRAAIFNPNNHWNPDYFQETNGRVYKTPIIAFPDDTVFEGNRADVSIVTIQCSTVRHVIFAEFTS